MSKRIIFSDYNAISTITSGMLKKNGLQETLEEAYKKTSLGKTSNAKTITQATKDLFSKNILEKDLSLLLEKKFNTSKQIAKSILKDIKDKLIPLVQEVQIEESVAPEKDFVDVAIEQAEMLDTKEKKIPTEIVKRPSPENTQPKSAKQPDQYREPLL